MVKLFVVGAGKMGGAIAGGLVSKGVFAAAEVAAFDVNTAAASDFSRRIGCAAFDTVEAAKSAFAEAPAILLAVKPQVLESALEFWKNAAVSLSQKLVISIVAGVTIEKLASLTGGDRIVRVMPNTPALVGAGAAAYAPGPGATAEDAELVERILSAVGMARRMKESDLDAVTALSGSGPAYVFEFIMALADGGVYEGLPRDMALELAAQTVFGSAKMVLESTESPAVLRDAVISPAGTTARGVAKLDEGAFRSTVVKAVIAASERSAELGKL